KNPRLEPECITKEEGVVVTRREQRGDEPGTTTRRTQAGPWTLVALVCNISAPVLCQGSRTLHAGICFSAG
ncbi:unnamed protein product, partial [Ascophyllum nodosum]